MHWRTCFQYHYRARPYFGSPTDDSLGKPFWVLRTSSDWTLSVVELLLQVCSWTVCVFGVLLSVYSSHFKTHLLSQCFKRLLLTLVKGCCPCVFQMYLNFIDLLAYLAASHSFEAWLKTCLSQVFCSKVHSELMKCVHQLDSSRMNLRCDHFRQVLEFWERSFMILVIWVMDW